MDENILDIVDVDEEEKCFSGFIWCPHALTTKRKYIKQQ